MTTAAEPISLAREALRNTIADSARFRTWVNATGASAQSQARGRIHDDQIPPKADGTAYTLDEYQALFPYALIATAGFGLDADSVDIGGGVGYRDSGLLDVRFAWQIPPAIEHDAGEIARRFENDVGTILREVSDLAGTDGYLMIQGIRADGPMFRSSLDGSETVGDAMAWDFQVTWGVGGG